MAARILVVDDSAALLAAVRGHLEAVGYEVETAKDPALVANAVQQFQPDLVLLDVGMPGISGEEVLRALRRYDCCPEALIVLFSALEESELGALATRLGADGWVHKGSPLNRARLVRKVRDYLKTPPKPKPGPGRALLVDDSRAMRRLLGSILRELGFEVSEAAHGAEALDVLAAEGDPVRVMLVDLNMPVMSGYELIARLRQHPEHREIPVLTVTSETDPDRIAYVLASGADEHVMKPFSKDAVKAKLTMLGVVS